MIDFGALPPEINSTRMFLGPGPESLMTAASAWNQLAAEMNSAALGYERTIATLSSEDWLGSASTAMVDAVAPYVTWMTNTASDAELAASQARAAASAYETALTSTVPPPAVAANRDLLTQLVAQNVFGQYTAAIAKLEAQYGEMWAQDATAMYRYAGQASAATKMTPFASAPQVASPTAQAAQATATTSATATSAGNSQSTLSQIISSLPSQLNKLASPVSSSTSAATTTDPLTELYFLLTGNTTLPTNLGSIVAAYSPYSAIYYNTEGLPYFSVGMANFGVQIAKTTGMLGGVGPAAAAAPALHGLGGLGAGLGSAAAHTASAVSPSVISAGAGNADVVSRLSVPPAWTGATGALNHSAPIAVHSMTPAGAEGNGNLMGGMPVTGTQARAAGMAPKYGVRPTVMARPPFGG